MAEETATGGGGGGMRSAEKWVGQHKVLAIGGGGALLFVLLASRGKNVTVPGTVVNALPTDQTGADLTGGGGTFEDTPPPADTTTPDVTPPDTAPDPTPTPITPGVAPPPQDSFAAPATPAPNPPPPIPAPAQPTQPTALVVPTTISSVPPPPAVQQQQAVTYVDVPGYFTRILGYTKSTGTIREWHHYTSGTRKGDLVMSGVVGQYPKNQTTPPAGWGRASVLAGHEDWESPQGSVQYEVTHQASVNQP